MYFLSTMLASSLFLANAGSMAVTHKSAADTSSGAHAFDFEFGNWRVHHRVKRAADGGWIEFDGTCTDRALIDGSANVEENRFDKATGSSYGIAMRAFDPKSATW